MTTRAYFLGLLLSLAPAALAPAPNDDYVRYSGPEMFTYDELAAMSHNQPLAPELSLKIETITTTPFISNEAHYRGAQPHKPVTHHLGPSLRVAFWNIERGMRLDDIKLLFTDREAFIHKVAAERYEKRHSDDAIPENELEIEADAAQGYALLRAQIRMLQTADVIALNEVDWGMPRSHYREVVQELGEALDMNWTWGVEFIEIDPVVVGTESFDNVRDPQERQRLIDENTPDRSRLKALHGSAILSRYPIRSAKLVPFEVGYDWFSGEENLPIPEKIVRGLAGAMGDPLSREMRRGGRMALYAELDVPDLPEGKLMVVTPHLENRAKPDIRKAQLAQVLDAIQDIDYPVIVASDFNTTGTDFSPKTFTGLLQQAFLSEDMTPELIAVAATPIGLQYSVLHFGIQIAHNQADPTVTGIPVLAPNYERPLFEMVEEYRFADGHAFDLRGDVERTHDGIHEGKLANSNDRADKGFEPTFETGTMGFFGEFKLDWMLVKSYVRDPFAPDQTYRFAPHGAWVMKLLNNAPLERLSDHHPMAVTLPFEEPDVRKPPPEQVVPGTVPEWAQERMRQRRAAKERAEPPADLSTIALGEYSCAAHVALVDESPGVAGVRNIWGLGYHYGRSGLDETWPTISYDKVVRFMDRVQTLCERSPDALWFEIIRGLPPERARGGITTFFDLRPGQYTCQQHLDLAASENQLAETRAVWADGYDAVHRGIDATSPPITANELVAYSRSILEKCREKPDELWVRVVRHDEVHAKAAELELSWDELASATYHGIYDDAVTLEDGVYESASGRVELVRDFALGAHLHGDGLEEAVVLLSESSGGSGSNLYLAVVAHDNDGAVNRGTALVGDRVQVMDGRIEDGRIVLDVVQAGPEDAMCCPSQKATRRWTAGASTLREEPPQMTGTLSLADLEDVDWVLTHFDVNEPAPEEPDVSLYIHRGRVAGNGGCNRYFADAHEGDMPGSITLGPVGATRMACPGAADEVESRFLQQLGGASSYRFVAGKLALTSNVADTNRTMYFSRKP